MHLGGFVVTEYDHKYQDLADMNRRIVYLANKEKITASESKELEILEMARDYGLRTLSRRVMAREG